MARTWREITRKTDFEEVLELSKSRPQAVLITSPTCKACKRFKEKDFQKIVDQFPNTDWNEVNAFDSGIEEFSSPGILPKWNFFVDGKLKIEFPGVVWKNIDDAVCDCEWIKGIKRVIRMG
ncbi:unnamed protein product [Oikopleura dioica]|uniref:Thioredoxin domain-containing protein n=1 Tax=Oikopleura dioica TaxID=34765 RepID=E4Y5U8_OIKDI|nr:unnamed protein product [Oikopleura dioica]